MKQNLYDNPQFFEMYKSLRESKITYNDFIEQPAIKKMLPDLKGLKVLDLGCGFGELAIDLIRRGAAQVTGVDISERMLSIAKKHPQIDYFQSSMEDIEFQRHEFDLIVSSLAFHYIEDYGSLIGRVATWLKPNGFLIFSTEHPMVLAHKSQEGWITDSNGNRLHWPIDNYNEEGPRSQFWGIDGVIKYHRKISTLINGLIHSGLMIQEIDEPESTVEGLEKMPKLMSERRRPSFIIIKAQKHGIDSR
ncbi:class I SAM-dependent methyltransferase [Paenibacillus sp. DYY-L-2]|uniref:class I SAM-dependent methyltransferase n=1 Tax=Paenibacillus sp. DYY-L-2 TaxID=3447013 RepID=UPI003F4FCF11